MNRKYLFALTVILILAVILCVGVACAPTQNQGSPSGDNGQNGNQIFSGDNQMGDSDDQTQNPSFPSGDTGSGNIGSGDSDTDEIENGGNNSDIGEEKPEVKYPSTIAEMTDKQKKILTDYLDETYKEEIVIGIGIKATAENTETIGYTLEGNRMTALYNTSRNGENKIYTVSTDAVINISKFFEFIEKNEDPSEYAKLTYQNTAISEIFVIPQTENEYSANAENAYKFLNNTLEDHKLTNNSSQYYTQKLQPTPYFGIALCPVSNAIRVSVNEKEISLHSIMVVTPYYNKLGIESVDFEIRDENYLKFGSENTIWNLKIQTDDNYNYVVQNDKVYLMNYKGNSVDVVIPNAIDGKEVVSIGNVFTGDKDIKSIVLPNGVTSIGKYQFSGCSSLTRIEIQSGVTSIGEGAFSGCSSVISITVDANNACYKSDGNCIIEKETNTLILGCKNSVIPNYVTSIDSYAFYNCNSLTRIEIPSGVTSIGDYAFRYCSGLTRIEIPSSVTSIGSNAFSSCSSLTIYCEAASLPSGWSNYWNSSNRPVVWGYNK